MDEDDEAAFMRAHAARVHSITKPMNISVLSSSGAGGVGGISVLGGEQQIVDTTLFNPNIPPPMASPVANIVKLVPRTLFIFLCSFLALFSPP